jgi:hypothetical protein
MKSLFILVLLFGCMTLHVVGRHSTFVTLLDDDEHSHARITAKRVRRTETYGCIGVVHCPGNLPCGLAPHGYRAALFNRCNVTVAAQLWDDQHGSQRFTALPLQFDSFQSVQNVSVDYLKMAMGATFVTDHVPPPPAKRRRSVNASAGAVVTPASACAVLDKYNYRVVNRCAEKLGVLTGIVCYGQSSTGGACSSSTGPYLKLSWDSIDGAASLQSNNSMTVNAAQYCTRSCRPQLSILGEVLL